MNEEKTLSPQELYELKKKEKKSVKKHEVAKEKVKKAPKKIGKIVLYLVGAGVIIFAIYFAASFIPNLPPTSSENHVEDSPAAHILTTRMPDAIQRHMLEHADGNGPPGVIIQYNCKSYECSSDLVSQLGELVTSYDEGVYLAPNKYDGKIILTKPGKRLILDSFNEETIREFIGR